MNRIRPATEADSQAVARLVLLAIQDIAYQLTGADTEEAVLDTLERFYLIPGNRFSCERYLLQIADDGQVAGMLLGYKGNEAEALYLPVVTHLQERLGGETPPIDEEADDDEFYIDALAVFPAYEGRGYAKALIAGAEAWAGTLGYRKVGLNVDVDKDKAHAIYSKLGYVEDKIITINGHPYRHMIKNQ